MSYNRQPQQGSSRQNRGQSFDQSPQNRRYGRQYDDIEEEYPRSRQSGRGFGRQYEYDEEEQFPRSRRYGRGFGRQYEDEEEQYPRRGR
ncbi:hypothetical protein K7432_003974 [Basidiobolus ranarum]|uniref:Uncharacterized protein n=1 Tax=Basidiobolus ranarum TaxID=34480 RepID=A0ABR2W5R1_9FUNG